MALEGIDVSHYQDTTPPLAGLSFLFARATIGTTPDDRYVLHTTTARAAGLVVGAYHFGIGGGVPAQATAFLAAATGADLLALDLESYSSGPSMTDAEAQAFIAAVHAAGRKVGLYHSESGYPIALGQDWNWVAHWGTVTPPAIPWAFWQYQGSPLDRDRFAGDQVALLTLAGRPPALTYTLHVAAGARVLVATVKGSCIAGWTTRVWGPKSSSAPSLAPVSMRGCASGSARVAKVTAGAFAGRFVRLGPGVTVISHQ